MNNVELEDYLKTRYDRKVVCGYEFSHHAMARMMQRHIRLDWVLEALEQHGYPQINGTLKHIGPFATVAVNPQTRQVTTVAYGYKNQHLEKHEH